MNYQNLVKLLRGIEGSQSKIRQLEEEIKKRDIMIGNRDIAVRVLREALKKTESQQSKTSVELIEIRGYVAELVQKLEFIKDGRLLQKVLSVLGYSRRVSKIGQLALLAKNRISNLGTFVPEVLDFSESKKYVPSVNNAPPPSSIELESSLVSGSRELNLDSIHPSQWKPVVSALLARGHTSFMYYAFGGKLRLVDRDTAQIELARTNAFLNRIRAESLRKCVVIGNGPSLKKHDFSYIRDKFLIGSNYIFLLEKTIGRLPDIISITNYLVLEQRLEDVLKLNTNIVVPLYMYDKIGRRSNVYYLNIHHNFEFSSEIELSASTRATVTFFNLQLAYSLGFKECYLIGVDNSYIQPTKREGKVIVQESDDGNHFDPNYFKGLKWQSADTDMMAEVYRLVKKAFIRSGRQIFNAGIGGALEVFERVDYSNALLSGSTEKSQVERTKSARDIVISINPDLCDGTGHHLHFDQRLAMVLVRKGCQIVSLTSRQIDVDVNDLYPYAVPTYSRLTHEIAMRDFDQNLIDEFVSETLIGLKRTLETLSKDVRVTVFMYCSSFSHLYAFNRIAPEFRFIKFKLHLFYPSFESSFDRDSTEFGREVLIETNSIPNIELLGGSHSFIAYFNNEFARRLSYLPWASTTYLESPKPKKNSENRIAFLGNMRPEKGGDLTIETLLRLCADPRFKHYTFYSRRPDAAKDASALSFENLLGERVVWINSDVSCNDFQNFIEVGSINVITYNKKAFHMRPSGVFSDTLLAKRPCIVAEGTEMGKIVKELGNGLTFECSNAEDLVEKIWELISDFDAFSEKAEMEANEWCEENSWQKLLELLLY